MQAEKSHNPHAKEASIAGACNVLPGTGQEAIRLKVPDSSGTHMHKELGQALSQL